MNKTKALEKLANTPAHFTEERDNTQQEEAEEGIDYGVLILPPVLDEHNEELDSYPDEYIEYVQDRLKDYKEEHGELPKYVRDRQTTDK